MKGVVHLKKKLKSLSFISTNTRLALSCSVLSNEVHYMEKILESFLIKNLNFFST